MHGQQTCTLTYSGYYIKTLFRLSHYWPDIPNLQGCFFDYKILYHIIKNVLVNFEPPITTK